MLNVISWLSALSLFSLCSVTALAQSTEGESTLPIESLKDKNATTNGEDVDDLITNAKMRAESGSKSRYSVQSIFNYAGGTISSPGNSIRPNIQGVSGDTAFSDIDGSVNVKYNLTTKDSLLFGGGVRWVAPFNGSSAPNTYHGDRVDIFNPSLNYQRIYRVGGVQSYFQFGPTLITQSDYTQLGYIGNIGLSNVSNYEFGHTGLSFGIESNVGYGWFRPATAVGGLSADGVLAQQSDYNIYLFPVLEYKINDRFNLRTVSFLLSYEHFKNVDNTLWHRDVVTQSVGLGISVTRDLFLYPNVQFIPDHISAQNTNVGVTADINVF